MQVPGVAARFGRHRNRADKLRFTESGILGNVKGKLLSRENLEKPQKCLALLRDALVCVLNSTPSFVLVRVNFCKKRREKR